jgi:vacuolar-type H+-ATPase subunit H
MEKIWDELKKIEAQAEKILNEAQTKSTVLVSLAKKEGEQLLKQAKIYAEEDSQEFYLNAIQEANQAYEEKLKIGRENGEKLIAQAKTRVDQCVDIIVKAVMGESNLASSDKIR